MFSFDSPNFLYLLLLLPIAVLCFWLMLGQLNAIKRQFHPALPSRLGNPSGRFRYLRLSLWFLLGSSGLIVALAGPQIEREKLEPVYSRLDLVFLLDTSPSMRARDIVPSRIDRAREEIQNLILHQGQNIGRVGLVNFSGSSMILSYLTDDVSNILFYLDYLRAETRPSFGTDIGSAIKSGLTLVEKERELDELLQYRNLLFILISDGEDHGTALQAAVQEAANLDIRIYCLGLGSQLGDYIPIGERDGRTVFLVNEEGEKLLATFDEVTLRRVAESTRGHYYRSHTGSELYENLVEILDTEKKVIGERSTTEKTSLYYWFIAAGFSAFSIFLIE